MSSHQAQAGAASILRPALPDVLLEHLEELAFLSVQRRRLLCEPEVPLRRLQAHDGRMAAHLDGLAEGRRASLAPVEEKLGGEDPWEIVAAARVWMTLARPDAAAVAVRLEALPDERLASWREALRGADPARVRDWFPAPRVLAWPAGAQSLAVDALGWHGQLDATLAAPAAKHPSAHVRRALARQAAHSPDAGAPLVAALLEDVDERVRRHALWSLALLAPGQALARARRLVQAVAPEPFAARVLGVIGEPEDAARLAAAAATDSGRPAALFALGDLGTAESVEALIRLLALPDSELAGIVGEALEGAIGTVPRAERDAPPSPEGARAHWSAVAKALPRDARARHGRALPWNGEPDDEPMEWLWRTGLARPRPEAPWLRREVPDGWFDARPAPDARPGE